jgi:hypothetical protein
MRAVMLAMEEAAGAIRALSATMRAWGTQLGYAASMTLPRIVLSPVGTGAMGAVGTAAMGDTQPSDLIQAFAMSYLEDGVERRGAGRQTEYEIETATDKRLEQLGRDPATGGYRPSEMETARRVEHALGVQLERARDPNVDWVDGSGRTYDAVG